MTTNNTEAINHEVNEPAAVADRDEQLKHEPESDQGQQTADQGQHTVNHAIGKFFDRVRTSGLKKASGLKKG